jgi:hypothetical protein
MALFKCASNHREPLFPFQNRKRFLFTDQLILSRMRMSLKKSLILIFVLFSILLLGSGRAFAQLAEANAVTATPPQLSSEIIISSLDNDQYLPAVAYNWKHDEYLVAWNNFWGAHWDIYAQRVSGQGELKSWFSVGPTAPLNPYPNDRAEPSVAYDFVHDRYLIVWAYDTSGNGSNWDIHGIFIDWNGPIQGLHQFNICDWPTQQWDPKVVYNSWEDEFMVVWWTDHPSVPGYISGRRIRATDGTFPSTGPDFSISDASEDRGNPEIAYNPNRNEYLVVYDNTQDILGQRFSSKGAPLSGGEFAIAAWPGAETQPSVALCSDFTYDQYLVAWQNPQPDIYARSINGDGSLDGGPLHLEYTGVDEIYPQVACNLTGNQFFVVWQQQFSNRSGPYGVWGQFVNTDKTLGAATGIMTPTGGVAAEFTKPVVAGGGVNFLSVWEHDRAGTAFQDIHGRLIIEYAVFLPLLLEP